MYIFVYIFIYIYIYLHIHLYVNLYFIETELIIKECCWCSCLCQLMLEMTIYGVGALTFMLKKVLFLLYRPDVTVKKLYWLAFSLENSLEPYLSEFLAIHMFIIT